MSEPARKPSLWEAVTSVAAAAALISCGVLVFDGEVPVPVLLLLACVTPAALALRQGRTWADLEDGMAAGMSLALKATAILLVVGTTIAAWAASGTIAAMVSYGLRILSPGWFLAAACGMCSLVSLAIGSSWATAATVGVALMGIGGALGVPPAMSAGAILSGSYFGDKMSPLSDTTNLAPGVAGSELFEHIHAMLYTTMPAFGLALLLYAALGLLGGGAAAAFDPSSVTALQRALAEGQHLSLWLLLPPALVVVLAVLRFPALPVLLLATALGALLAWWVQGVAPGAILAGLYRGYVSSTGIAAVDQLLSRGGMASMLDTIALVLTATAFGGIMERAGFIQVLLEALLRRVRGAAGLITATVLSCTGVNFLVAEQYLAIVLPGRMFRDAYARFGLQPRMLSRTLEDAGTVTSPLCPWNSCGAYMAATLGVATFSYAPYAFLNLLVPVIAITYAWTDTFILRQASPSGAAEAREAPAT